MIVCICHDVRDSQIKAALASGVNSMSGLKDSLSVATSCGCCEPMVNDLLEEHLVTNVDSAMVNQLTYAV